MQSEKVSLAKGIERLYSARHRVLVIALTGRTGSGCTTAAEILSRPFSGLAFDPEEQDEPERRKLKIARSFASKNWKPFTVVSASTVILAMLLACEDAQVREIAQGEKLKTSDVDAVLAFRAKLVSDARFAAFLDVLDGEEGRSSRVAAWELYSEVVKKMSESVRASLGGRYQQLFQRVGDNIRRSGNASSDVIDPEGTSEQVA